ncbi:MAG: NAD(P)/FAD-dependent oxidoreductase [Myxococcales bacterium]|nr:NAD(P)/FAD-dependent oxidoreductase [Myxococcales bacterium]MCB9626191.1 NAD(P)/FAD-dependent oxidoreductase [Sandaracinaceae bacterium]
MAKRAVVIGTGAGGLTASAALAQEGFEVIALERAKQLGGFLNPFARRHYHFDPGVHYVGQAAPGESLHRVLRRVGLDAQELFCPMDPDGFDVVRFPDFELRIPVGLDRFRDRIVGLFPADQREIDAFIQKLSSLHALINGRGRDLRRLRGLPIAALWYTRTFGELLAQSFTNPRVAAVFAAQCGDYGLPPSKAPAILGVAVFLHFIDGSYFPRGGSGSLRDALVERGRAHGAVYRRKAEVARINVDGQRVTGVTLADGERIDADVVISAVDPKLTYGQFLPSSALPSSMVRKVAKTQASVGSICVFLGLERDLRDHGMGAFNVWDYPSWDIESAFGPALAGRLPDDFAFFLSPNSLKDDTGSMAPAGCSTLEVVTLAPFAPFAKWADSKSMKRPAEYEAFKDEVGDKLLAAVERRWPGLVGDVAVKDVSTPVTNIHFAGAVDGAIYGPAALPEQFALRAYKPKGPLEGLYHAGAGVMGPGVVPCLASGVMAAKLAVKEQRERRVSFFARPRLAAS